MKLKLTSRILLYFVLLAAGLLLTVGELSYRSGRENLKAAAISEMLATAFEKDSQLNGWTDERLAGLSRLTRHPQVATMAASLIASAPATAEALAALRRELEAELSGPHGGFTEVFILEPDGGKVVVSTRPSAEGKSLAGQPFFEKGKTGLYLSQAYYSADLGGLTMTAAAPLSAPDGRVVAELAANINLAFLTDMAQRRTGLRQSAEVFLINAGGFPITQPRFLNEPVALRHPLNTEAVRRCAAGDSGVILAADYRGVPSIAVYRWNASHRFGLIVEIDQAEALAPVRAFGRELILISGLGLLVAGGFAILLARTITRPLLRLQTGVQRFAEGTFAEPLPESDDEVGSLAHGFNCMTARIAERTAALANSEARHRTLFEGSRDAIMTLEPPAWEFTTCNPATVALFGTRDADHFTSLTPWKLSPERQPDGRASAEKAKEMIETAMRDGSHLFEWTYRRVNGEAFSANVLLSRLETDGKPFLQATVRDITERRRIEAELQKLDKLQSIGTLAGGIAHDFNNILQGLYGNIAIAMDDLPQDHPSYEPLANAEKSMARAVRLTGQLLTFSKGGAPVKDNVSLGALVGETVWFELSGSKVRFDFRQAEGLWPVLADKGQIQQVISALLINACQAMPNGGHLHIALENADLSAATLPALSKGRYVRVTVQDDGPGIAPAVLSQIFDPYFSTKQTGRGLGLATVWSIITKHGGHIGVVSELGKGATFTFYLPASETPQQTVATPSASERPTHILSRPTKILVMDDEALICRLAVQMLSPCGYSVTTAPGGREAIALYKQAMEAGQPFDVVIMDLTIPGGIGGKEAVKDLSVLDPNIRAIVCSGYADDPVMANPAAYGFKAALAKPYTISKLREAVARVLA